MYKFEPLSGMHACIHVYYSDRPAMHASYLCAIFGKSF